MLARGGNAVDAAVAAAFASFIAEIGVVHLGGSGVAQVYVPAAGGQPAASTFYDFFSRMPGQAAKNRPEALDFERVVIDFGPASQEFYLGHGSVAVPGNIAGLCQLAADYGRLPLPDLLAPAVQLAEKGVALAPFQADTCLLLSPLYTHTAGMRRIFSPNGHMIRPGERLRLPDMARTLRALAREGPEYARTGALAEAFLADQAANGGLLTAADLRHFEVRRSAPIEVAYRGFKVLLPGPSSSGGVLVAYSLLLLAAFDPRRFPYGSASHLALLYEIMATVGRARPDWEQALAALPAGEAVTAFLDPAGIERRSQEVAAALTAGRPSLAQAEALPPPDTSHLSVIDGQGMAVSLTTTAGESAGYVVPGTGFIPNNILGEADLHPAGFHSRRPGEPIPTMMTPAVVLHNGQIRLVVGSGGSIRIRSAILQVLSNFLDYGFSLDGAVNAPRVHLEAGVLQCEFGTSQAAMERLAARGYPVNAWDKRSIYFGGAHSVAREPDGRLVAAGDDRRGGAVARVG
ncbi:MAG: gamma-glutamyltransferase family protein [Candidatus Promineifilaceae bacterium]